MAPLLDFFGRISPKDYLETERGRLQTRIVLEQVAGEHIGEGTVRGAPGA